MVQKIANEALALSDLVVEGLQEKKGVAIVRMDLRKVSGAITDYFVVATGTSDKHVQALAASVEDTIREKTREKPMNKEGYQLGEWILLDYTNVVVHVFQRDKRDFYRIEDLWGDGEIKKFDD